MKTVVHSKPLTYVLQESGKKSSYSIFTSNTILQSCHAQKIMTHNTPFHMCIKRPWISETKSNKCPEVVIPDLLGLRTCYVEIGLDNEY